MKKATVEYLKGMYEDAKEREEMYVSENSNEVGDYSKGFLHGTSTTIRDLFNALEMFEKVKLFEE